MNADKVIALLRDECSRAGSQRAWAMKHGISAPYVADVLRGRREPAGKVLDALGLERVVTYEPTRKGKAR